jgi:hypothetical protein
MPNFLIWRRGLRGPSIAIVHGKPFLDEHDRANKMSAPIQICEQHERLSLGELAKLYPAPHVNPEPAK